MTTKRKEREREKDLTWWRPVTSMMRLQDEAERLFGDFSGAGLRPFWNGKRFPIDLHISAPLVHLYDDLNQIVVKAELPGMAKDDIEIEVSAHQVTLKGEKKKEEEIKEEDYYRSERSYGSFTRALVLHSEPQSDKVHASYKNGVLEIRLPKTEETIKKEIKVKVE